MQVKDDSSGADQEGGGRSAEMSVCVGLLNRGNVNSRMCLFIVEVLVSDLKWNPELVSGSCVSLWTRGVIGLYSNQKNIIKYYQKKEMSIFWTYNKRRWGTTIADGRKDKW